MPLQSPSSSATPTATPTASPTASPSPSPSPPMTFPEKLVAIQPVGGLASRMKCMASFAVIAQWFRTPLHVHWTGGPGFEDIPLTDLFSAYPQPTVLLSSDEWTMLRTKTPRVVRLEEHVPYLVSTYSPPMYKLETLLSTRKPYRLTAECNRELFAVYGHVLSNAIPGFHRKYMELLHTFRPSPSVCGLVREEVRAWQQLAADSTSSPDPSHEEAPAAPAVLGIHVRRCDALQSPMQHRYRKFTDEDMHEHIRTHLAKSAQHLVFVSTDDADTHRHVLETYRDEPRVRSFPWKRHAHKHGWPKGGQRKALVDLWVLRCCAKVQGTPFSVFTQVGSVPLLPAERTELMSAVMPGDCSLPLPPACTEKDTATDTHMDTDKDTDTDTHKDVDTDTETDTCTHTTEPLPPNLSYLEHVQIPGSVRAFDTETEPAHITQQRLDTQKRLETAITEAHAATERARAAAVWAVKSAAAAATAAATKTTRAAHRASEVEAAAWQALETAAIAANRAVFQARQASVRGVLVRRRVLLGVLREALAAHTAKPTI